MRTSVRRSDDGISVPVGTPASAGSVRPGYLPARAHLHTRPSISSIAS